MRDRPKTKSQRKASRLASEAAAANVIGRAQAATNQALGQGADRLGTPGNGLDRL